MKGDCMSVVKRCLKMVIAIVSVVVIMIASFVFWHTYRQTKQVNTLAPIVESVAKRENMMEYVPYIEGIIFTESAGTGTDVMQASESKYGKRGNVATQEESIDAGIRFLRKAVTKAQQEHCDIWTAIQAYNFGLNYIDYVAKHGKKNSIQLAEQYSKDYLAAKDDYGKSERYRYYHLDAFLYNGGFLYRNGGNFFYADKVKHSMKWIQWINRFLLHFPKGYNEIDVRERN